MFCMFCMVLIISAWPLFAPFPPEGCLVSLFRGSPGRRSILLPEKEFVADFNTISDTSLTKYSSTVWISPLIILLLRKRISWRSYFTASGWDRLATFAMTVT